MRIAMLALAVAIAGEAPDSCCEGGTTGPTPTGPTAPTGPTGPTSPGPGTDLAGGRLEGTLDRAGSPYRVHGDVFVPSTGTLTIEPGVTLRFAADPEAEPFTQRSKTRLLVFGNVIAQGTAELPIVFTAENQTIGWWGIVQNTDAVNPTITGQHEVSTRASIYDHVVFEYARKDGEWWADSGPRPWSRGGALNVNLTGLTATPGQITIIHSTFRHNFAREACGAFDLMTAFAAVVSHNVIENNEARDFGGGGACVSHGDGVIVSDNVFRNNHAANPQGGPTDINGGGGLNLVDTNDTQVFDNRFENNSVTGPYAPGSAILDWTTFATSTIRHNVFVGNTSDPSLAGAVYLLDADLMIIEDNDFSLQAAPWVVEHPASP